MAAIWTSSARTIGPFEAGGQRAPCRQELLPARCRYCRRLVVFVRLAKGTNHKLHGVLSLLTGGIWIPIWILATCRAGGEPWECAECGRRR